MLYTYETIRSIRFFTFKIFMLDDLHETKNALTEVNRRYHELELDYRRIENEREELAAAYKEAEAVRSNLNEIMSILFE